MQHTTMARYRANAVADTVRAQGRSVAWLARQLGMSRPYTSDIVHGRIVVRRDVAERIAALLGMAFFVAFEVSDDTEKTPLGEQVG